MTKQKPSLLGGICIIASVCVGAGMLVLPCAGAGAWTLWSFLVLMITMIVMTISGWLLLEAFKNYDLKVSFNTVTKDLLGNKLNIINNIAVYFVCLILLYAYITSTGLILQSMLGLNSKINSVLFVLIFAIVIWHSTRAVDRISIMLITFMILSFSIGVFGLTKHINLNILFNTMDTHASYARYTMALLPVALTSFGYHHTVTSIRAYYGNEKRAKYAILGGTMIALTFYTIWIVSIYANIPRNQFPPIIKQGGGVELLLASLRSFINPVQLSQTIRAFSIAAILSSFIGVGLGLFDFLADLFKFENTKYARSITGLITFIPPLTLSLISPFGFMTAISYAGAIATIFTCITPGLLVLKVRARERGNEGFTTPGGKIMIVFVIAFGVVTAVFHFLSMVGKIPLFTG
ncbi:MAG: tryptophan permease [Psychromonas sp.]|nr:tryptophan permease [Psychromonas sp.]